MILHITNDYSGSTVYKNLVRELDNIEVDQIVYNPIRDLSRINKNSIDFKQKNSKIIYSYILNSYTDRILYQRKIHKIVKDIEDKVDLSKIKFIHAHTWYSDGGVAYLLNKKYKIPYIVAVRNTDLNIFHKFFIHERYFGRKILDKANSVVTISSVYKKRLLDDHLLKLIFKKNPKKLVVIPNGVDPFWINNFNLKTIDNSNIKKINLLYVGKFDKGKNVINLVKAIKKLNLTTDYNCILTLVGGGGNDHVNVLKEINQVKEINFKENIFDKKILLDIYRNNDFFLMPSKAETFGLVYVEAMLQGLPILYTHNEGIDGAYNENIGEKIFSFDVIEIQNKIETLVRNKDHYNIPTNKLVQNHDWKNISKTYKMIYSDCIELF